MAHPQFISRPLHDEIVAVYGVLDVGVKQTQLRAGGMQRPIAVSDDVVQGCEVGDCATGSTCTNIAEKEATPTKAIQNDFVPHTGNRVERYSGMKQNIYPEVHVKKLITANEHRPQHTRERRIRLV